VQYHPEISLLEVAAAVRRQAGELIKERFAKTPGDLEAYAATVEALHAEPERRDLAWRLGLDEQVTDPDRRLTELRNFIEHLVRPGHSRQHHG
jgi:GMP synthase (glutamine-hydrolysing)